MVRRGGELAGNMIDWGTDNDGDDTGKMSMRSEQMIDCLHGGGIGSWKERNE